MYYLAHKLVEIIHDQAVRKYVFNYYHMHLIRNQFLSQLLHINYISGIMVCSWLLLHAYSKRRNCKKVFQVYFKSFNSCLLFIIYNNV